MSLQSLTKKRELEDEKVKLMNKLGLLKFAFDSSSHTYNGIHLCNKCQLNQEIHDMTIEISCVNLELLKLQKVKL